MAQLKITPQPCVNTLNVNLGEEEDSHQTRELEDRVNNIARGHVFGDLEKAPPLTNRVTN